METSCEIGAGSIAPHSSEKQTNQIIQQHTNEEEIGTAKEDSIGLESSKAAGFTPSLAISNPAAFPTLAKIPEQTINLTDNLPASPHIKMAPCPAQLPQDQSFDLISNSVTDILEVPAELGSNNEEEVPPDTPPPFDPTSSLTQPPNPNNIVPEDASISTSTISNQILEVDSAEFDDNDSAISAFREESTQSVRSSLFDYIEENGRTFHRYKEGKYVLPNDEIEQNRLDLQHQMLLIMMDGQLHLAPIGDNPQKVLDVGCGTGIWAIEFASRFPSASVIGTDLSPIQPQFVPANCQFEVDDAEDEWVFNTKFDFVHMRGMMTCFSDPRSILAKAFEATDPGGYLEIEDSVFPMHCHDDSLLGTPLDVWGKACVEASHIIGRPWTNTPNYRRWMIEIGFEDVKEKIFEVPTSTWPKGRKAKELGMWWQTDLLDALGASMAVLTRGLGWSPEYVERFLVDVRASIRDRNVHAYMPIHVVWGRRPLPEDMLI